MASDKQREEKQLALEKIAAEIAECDDCRYLPNQRPVPGEGDPEAEIMLIGEAPGSKENETGRPFVGAAGKFLEEMLNSIGLERSDVFIANVIKFQPPNNRDPLPEEIARQKPFLDAQIVVIEPKMIVFLGRHALQAVLPSIKQSISELHGQLLVIDHQHYLPLYHPAAALYNGSMRQTLLDDFGRLPEYMESVYASSLISGPISGLISGD
ncbi:MAG: uracil-DNA glycosylase [Patescibacteria group bacterium]